MDEIKKYGKFDKEILVDDRAKARDIVQEILNFGVSQQQILYIAYLLALELEDRDAMIKISNSIKQLLEGVGDDEESEKTNKPPTGIITT
jgi:methionine synthase II (cobalamin-independent)